MVFRLVISMLFLAFVATACAITSTSGEATEPVVSGVNPTSEAGIPAFSGAVIDPETCEGVLGEPPVQYRLDTTSLTDVADQSVRQVESMCSALFDSGVPGGVFLAVTLMKFKSDQQAVEQYEQIKYGFIVEDVAISEVNNADEGLIDQVSALIDRDGIDRIVAMRQGSWLTTVSTGPAAEFTPLGGGRSRDDRPGRAGAGGGLAGALVAL
ncbi:MAG: hypothetical protein O3B95_08175 [Chloroflexi bacterium]|nr:hypothetical protein [Chloroflexota bacterium]